MKPSRFTLLLIFAVGALLLSYLPKPTPASASSLWQVPIAKPVLVQEFRQPNADWSAGHRGVDYSVKSGQRVFAPHEGIVTFSGLVVDRNLLSIRHQNGRITSLEPVCSAKTKGTAVTTGEVIGTVCFGERYVSHCLPRLCLHFSVRTENGYLSPLMVLGTLSPSRLKPWDGLTCSRPSGVQC